MSKEAKARKPRARSRDVVLGAMNERLLAIPMTDELECHRTRLLELLDELQRSLNKDNGGDGE